MTAVAAPVELMPESLRQRGSDPKLLGQELLAIIAQAIEAHPRSQQKALGPSEVGHPCARRLGYQLLEFEEINAGDPNWKATVGTAIHAWLEHVMEADNRRWPGMPPRWIVEQTLFAGLIDKIALTGHCDLYDTVTCTVVDWKSVGPTQLRKYKSKGPGDQYRTQAHLYGRGWQLRGEKVENVAVMFLPRDGALKDSYYWTEAYDEQVALDGLDRVTGITRTVAALGHGALPVLGTADAFCGLCPFHRARSNDLRTGCPGDPDASTRTSATGSGQGGFAGLI